MNLVRVQQPAGLQPLGTLQPRLQLQRLLLALHWGMGLLLHAQLWRRELHRAAILNVAENLLYCHIALQRGAACGGVCYSPARLDQLQRANTYEVS